MSALDDAYRAAAVALFDRDQSRDKLVRVGMIQAQVWDDLPPGCGVHRDKKEAACAVVSAFLTHLADNPPEEMAEALRDSEWAYSCSPKRPPRDGVEWARMRVETILRSLTEKVPA